MKALPKLRLLTSAFLSVAFLVGSPLVLAASQDPCAPLEKRLNNLREKWKECSNPELRKAYLAFGGTEGGWIKGCITLKDAYYKVENELAECRAAQHAGDS